MHVGHILEENRRRVQLGWVTFTPATLDDKTSYRTQDSKEVKADVKTAVAADTKAEPVADTKETAAAKTKKTTAKATE